MQRKKLHIKRNFAVYFLGLFSFYGHRTYAQTTSITLPQSNIQTRSDYNTTINVGTYTSVITLLPSFSVKSTAATFTSTTSGSFPASVVHMKLSSIGSLVLLALTGNNEVALSTGGGLLYTALASVASGAITANARIATASQTWTAGVFTDGVSFYTQGILAGSISPTSYTLSIIIPGFISPPSSIGTTSIAVNDLSFYRSANGISTNQIIPVSSTVPYVPSIRSSSAQFSFSTTFPNNASPASSVSTVSASLSGVATATSAILSTSDQTLTSAAGIAVPTNNSSSITHTYAISTALLKSNFIQAGTYTVPLTYTWNKLSSAYPTTPVQAQASGSLNVVVSDLGEIIANQQSVNLPFTTTSNYVNGVSTNMPTHIKLSKTTPYNLYVRATSSSFTSGVNSIPLSVLRIGPMAGQTGVNTVTLSTTAQQLIQNADPVIDRTLDMQYSIPASQTSNLLGKPAGTYTADIIYSFVAP
ncbi:hypothetical protein K2F45_01530 [Sphingobacterium siyangense]|uniref:hypothetical protein n=1 Tax=Sphingobacterium siyangense TaxID=459529 RepID=UPI00200F18F7|nr:hypothetical protein [Sphingobacterium siyangense]UQA75720.1 hypothetical protein K2F45_01530 [Sphingobacterium siyangense]